MVFESVNSETVSSAPSQSVPRQDCFGKEWIDDRITRYKQEATIRHTVLHLHFTLGNLVTATEEFQMSSPIKVTTAVFGLARVDKR